MPARSTGYAALANLTVSSFITVLNTNMIRVAIGPLMDEFGISVTELTWLFTAYTLVYAILMPVFGRLGDVYGRKRFFLGGLAVFAIGSAMCSASWSFGSLVACRCVQALGAAAVFPNALVMATELFGPERRGWVLGIWAASSSLGSMIGPTVGGVLTEYLAWRSVFYVNIPIGALAVLFGFVQLRESRGGRRPEPFDVAGAVCLGLGMLCLLLYLTGARERGWLSLASLLLLGLAAAAGVVFAGLERRAKSPLLDLGMFRSRAMVVAFGLGMVHMFCGQGSTFLLPLFLTEVKKLSPAVMGLVMFPGSLVGVAGGPISGGLSDRFGSRKPVATGMAARACSNVLFALLSRGSAIWQVIALRFVTVFGGSATWSPLLSFVLAENPAERAGVVAGVFNMIRFVGGILGTTFTGMIVDTQMGPDGYAGGGQATGLGGVPGFFEGFMLLAAVSFLGLLLAMALRHSAAASARVASERQAAAAV